MQTARLPWMPTALRSCGLPPSVAARSARDRGPPAIGFRRPPGPHWRPDPGGHKVPAAPRPSPATRVCQPRGPRRRPRPRWRPGCAGVRSRPAVRSTRPATVTPDGPGPTGTPGTDAGPGTGTRREAACRQRLARRAAAVPTGLPRLRPRRRSSGRAAAVGQTPAVRRGPSLAWGRCSPHGSPSPRAAACRPGRSASPGVAGRLRGRSPSPGATGRRPGAGGSPRGERLPGRQFQNNVARKRLIIPTNIIRLDSSIILMIGLADIEERPC